MKLTIASEIKGTVEIDGQFDDFFLWVAENRTDERLKSLLILLAEHDRETDEEERTNIRRTLDEILTNNHASVASGSPITDTERLNWLDKQGARYGWTVQLPSDYPNVRDCVFVCRNTTSGHKTIREAIAHRMGKPNDKDQPRPAPGSAEGGD